MNSLNPRKLALDVLTAPEIGEVNELLPGIHWLRLPVPFPPGHINLWLLQDGDCWTLVDCGLDSMENETAWQEIAQQFFVDHPLKRIIVTHHHADHLGMAAALGVKHDAEIVMTRGEFQLAKLRHFQSEFQAKTVNHRFWKEHGVLAQRGADYVNTKSVLSSVNSLPNHVQFIGDDELVQIGAYSWRAMVAGGHTDAHLCLYCDELDLLIAGDQVLPGDVSHIGVWPEAPSEDPIGDYLQSLNRLGNLPHNTWVLPSHGMIFNGLGQRVAELNKYYYGRLRQVFQECERPLSAAELIPSFFSNKLNDIQYQFALAEMVGCLNHLMAAEWVDQVVTRLGQVQYIRRNNKSFSA